MSATVGTYKGKPTLTLQNGENEKFPFTFGLKKAEMILSHILEIESFVANNKNSGQEEERTF